MKPNDVIALGSPLIDFLVEVEDQKLLEFNVQKGEMKLVNEEEAKDILQKIKDEKLSIKLCPGGSAANTLRGIGLLGGNVILIGKVGNDDHGEFYMEEMRRHNVKHSTNNNKGITGHAITFITPDSQRTFSTHLGAAVEITKEDIVEHDIATSNVLYIEGYQLEGKPQEAALHTIEMAKKHNTKVALDVSDSGVIRRNKEMFNNVLQDVDILFSNEDEAQEFTGKPPEEAISILGEVCNIAIIKIGAEGSLISHNGELIMIDPVSAIAIDTTGAGDTYAAGFLYGYTQGWDLKKAAELGSLMAAKIVELKGVQLDQIKVEEILKSF
jgi:sugar/nucleoside kinase (ribokinase family)